MDLCRVRSNLYIYIYNVYASLSCGLLSDCLLVGTQKLQESQDISVAARLEAAKRRLHERYEQVETGECYFATIVEVNSFFDLWSKVELSLNST